MAPPSLLVTSATGRQGGALIAALLNIAPEMFTIYALTRDITSQAAVNLATKHPTIRLIEGCTPVPKPILEQLPNLAAIFSVTVPGTNDEEAQAIPLIDAAIAHGVKHFVFTSADRGGPHVSDHESTQVPRFVTKFNIEQHLKSAVETPKGQGMKYTILRPVAFYDNLTPDFAGKVFATIVMQMGKTKLNMVGTPDIGRVAAEVFMRPDKYSGRALTLAGDSLDFEQLNQTFKKEVGKDVPRTWEFIVNGFLWAVDDMGKMFGWFKTGGYGYPMDVELKEELGLQSFRSWLRTDSKFNVLER